MAALWVAKGGRKLRLIRLCECADLFEYSMYTHVNLYHLLDTACTRKFFQRGPNFDNVLIEDPNTAINGPSLARSGKRHFNGVSLAGR